MNLISRGSLFHKYGAAAWKDRAPNVINILPFGGSNLRPSLDRGQWEDFDFIIVKRLLIYDRAKLWTALKVNRIISNLMQAWIGSQCYSYRIGVTCKCFPTFISSLVAAFCTHCTLAICSFEARYKRLLQ